MADRLADLSSRGVSIWLDDLSRERLTSGSLASLVARDQHARRARACDVLRPARRPAAWTAGSIEVDPRLAYDTERHRSAAWSGWTNPGLEQRGLELFDASWRELSDQLAARLRNPCHSYSAIHDRAN